MTRNIRLKNLQTFDLPEETGCHGLSQSEVETWASHDYWTLFEAALLLCGIDPDRWGPVGRSYPEMLNCLSDVELDPIEAENRLKTLYKSTRRNNQFQSSKEPVHFLICAQRLRLPVPDALHTAVLDRTQYIPDWGFPEFDNDADPVFNPTEKWLRKKPYCVETETTYLNANENTEAKDTTKRQISYKKLALGLAVSCFEYDPHKARNETGRIKAALAAANIDMDQGTIKSLLGQAATDLDHDFALLDNTA